MNTIHSSSLAYYPVGYKPLESVNVLENGSTTAQKTDDPAQKSRNINPSTTEQIKAALADNGLNINTDDNNKPTNSRTLKALNTYTDTRNQQAQRQVADIISGIDLYA